MGDDQGVLSISVLIIFGFFLSVLGVLSVEYQYFSKASQFHFQHQKSRVLAQSASCLLETCLRDIPVIETAKERSHSRSHLELKPFWRIDVNGDDAIYLAQDADFIYIVAYLFPTTWYIDVRPRSSYNSLR